MWGAVAIIVVGAGAFAFVRKSVEIYKGGKADDTRRNRKK